MQELSEHYQICNNCVMDTSDPEILFNAQGLCNYCYNFKNQYRQICLSGKEAEKALQDTLRKLKQKNRRKRYDAIIGLSGGVDSSYLAYWAVKKADLRLLAVHVDAGWNSEIAVSNIEKIVKGLNIDLYTVVVDWESMVDVQVAFLKSGVANQDTPQDHAFFAALYRYAVKNNIKTVLSGFNFSSEFVLPDSWGYDAMDLDQIQSIHKLYGGKKLSNFPTVSFFKNYIYYPYIKKMVVWSPLNYLNYNKANAIDFLKKELDWTYYGGKHYESRFTKFFQSYWLVKRFGYDKRRAHLSSLILANQMTRKEALRELTYPPYDEATIDLEKEFVAKKLKLSLDKLNSFMDIPKVNYTQYQNYQRKMHWLNRLKYILSVPNTIIKKIKMRLQS